MSKATSPREKARKRAEKITAKQASSDSRTRNILIGVIVVVILALVGVGYMLVKESQKTLLSELDGPTPTVANPHGGIPFGGADVVAGEVNSGATQVGVYADFLCPACAAFEEINAADLRGLIESGDATVVYHPVNILDSTADRTGYSTRSANAFVEVAENAPEHALTFMEALYANQPETADGLNDEEIAEIALAVGVPADVVDSFANGTYLEWVDVAREQAQRDGMQGTPSVAFDGTIETNIDPFEPGALKEYVLGS